MYKPPHLTVQLSPTQNTSGFTTTSHGYGSKPQQLHVKLPKRVCLKMVSTPLHPMVLLIIISFLNGYFVGGIPHFQTYPKIAGKSKCAPRGRRHGFDPSPRLPTLRKLSSRSAYQAAVGNQSPRAWEKSATGVALIMGLLWNSM